jgi:hypothetical protein
MEPTARPLNRGPPRAVTGIDTSLLPSSAAPAEHTRIQAADISERHESSRPYPDAEPGDGVRDAGKERAISAGTENNGTAATAATSGAAGAQEESGAAAPPADARSSKRRAEAELATFGWAEQAAVVRADQKDELYSLELLASISSALEATLGAGFINRHKPSLSAATNVVYLCLTSLCGTPTLGEEYVDIRQVSSHSEQPSRLGRRTALVVWKTLVPYLALLLQSKMLRRAAASAARPRQGRARAAHVHVSGDVLGTLEAGEGGGEVRGGWVGERKERAVAWLVGALPALKAVGVGFARLHLALFYARGLYPTIPHRLTGMHRPPPQPPKPAKTQTAKRPNGQTAKRQARSGKGKTR